MDARMMLFMAMVYNLVASRHGINKGKSFLLNTGRLGQSAI